MSVVRTWEVPNRKEIVAYLTPRLKTGDIILRESYTEGPFGIPFSTLVSKLSRSEFSHASLILMRNGMAYVCDKPPEAFRTPYVFEVNDRGSLEYRLIDWLDFCQDGRFQVLRHVDWSEALENALRIKIEEYLDRDEDYDFNYSVPGKLYCTESTMQIYNEVGAPVMKPLLIREIVRGWRYWAFALGNALVKAFTGKGFDLSVPVYFVGNDQQGILASKKLTTVASSQHFALWRQFKEPTP